GGHRRAPCPPMASPEKKSFLLRIDPVVWAEIERLAAAELRSANAQGEYLLRTALAVPRRGAAHGHPRPAAAAARLTGSGRQRGRRRGAAVHLLNRRAGRPRPAGGSAGATPRSTA